MRVLNQIVNSYLTPQQRAQLKKQGSRAISKVTSTILKTLPLGASDLYKTVASTYTAAKSGDDKVIKNQMKDLAINAAIEGGSLIGLEGVGKAGKLIAQAEKTLGKTTIIKALRGDVTAAAKVGEYINKIDPTFNVDTVVKIGSKIEKTLEPISKRITAVKANPKAAATIKKGVESLKSKQQEVSKAFDDFLEYAKKNPTKAKVEGFNDYTMSTLDEFFGTVSKTETQAINKAASKGVNGLSAKETDSIMKMLKNNGKGLEKLAKDVGVKSKAEIPNFLKFTTQLGDIIKNAPNYIKSQATGKDKLGILANAGLSIYDLYQAYKNNDNSLLPKSLNNVARMAGGLIPGNPILKIFYGGLGYMAADPLTKAAFAKLGVKHETSDIINKEIEAGIYQPGLSDEIPEFIEGQSGRKYHVMGNKIFDYATGRPVNITNALQDASDFVNYKTQEALDKKAQLEQQENDLRLAMQQGYNVDPSQLQQIQIEKETVQQQINSNGKLANQLAPLKFDPNGDLVEQYKQKVIAPEQTQQQVMQVQQDQQYRQTYNQIYEQAFNKIAQDTFDDMENYYTPQIQAIDYYEYNKMVNRGEAKPLTLDQFVAYQKQNTMRQLAPQIRQQADARVKDIINYESSLNDMDVKRYAAQSNALYHQQQSQIDLYKAEVDRAYKEGQINIDQYKALTDRIESNIMAENAKTNRMNAITNQNELGIKTYNAQTGRINAQTAQKEYERKQELLPYQQASYAGQTVMNAGMSGLSMDQFLNSNQSLFEKIFPGTQQGNQQDQTAQTKQNINNYYRGRQ